MTPIPTQSAEAVKTDVGVPTLALTCCANLRSTLFRHGIPSKMSFPDFEAVSNTISWMHDKQPVGALHLGPSKDSIVFPAANMDGRMKT
jgi:hypothetical protein